MAKKKEAPKKKAIKTIKVPVEPLNVLTYKGERYTKQENGNYLEKSTGKEVKLVKE